MTVSLPPHRHWDRGGKRPLLALHCSLAHAGAYSGLAQALHGVTLTAMDFIGHGKARDWDGVEDYHSAATAEAVALAESLSAGKPLDLIGHSFGGTVALRIAATRPDLVRSLTLIEPVFFAAARAAQDPDWDGFIADHRSFGAFARKCGCRSGDTGQSAADQPKSGAGFRLGHDRANNSSCRCALNYHGNAHCAGPR